MRITGGKARGVTLAVSKNAVRPAMDRTRQAAFSRLGNLIDNARVCDLFAGTGSYGLEALSRGARSVTFIEKDRTACSLIRRNLQTVSKSMGVNRLNALVVCDDVIKGTFVAPERFDLIFVDPPYNSIEVQAKPLFELLDRLLSSQGKVVFEMPGRLDLMPKDWVLEKRLGKGNDQPTLSFYRKDVSPTA